MADMATLPSSIRQGSVAPGFAAGMASAGASACAAVVVGTFGIAGAFAQWVGGSNAWIFFFLALKPLVDLTWRWSFFRFSEQSVNTQAIVGVTVLLLNGVAVLTN